MQGRHQLFGQVSQQVSHRMKQSRQENIIYLAAWGLLFAAPLLAMYIRTSGNDGHTFDWTEVMLVWR